MKKIKIMRSLLSNMQIDVDRVGRISSVLGEYGINNVVFSVDAFDLLTEYRRKPIPSTIESVFQKEIRNNCEIISCKMTLIISRSVRKHTIHITGSIRGMDCCDNEMIIMNALYSFLASTLECNLYLKQAFLTPIKIPSSLKSMYPDSASWNHYMSLTFRFVEGIERIDMEEKEPPKFLSNRLEKPMGHPDVGIFDSADGKLNHEFYDLNTAYNHELGLIRERNIEV